MSCTITSPIAWETKIRRSRFIAHIDSATSPKNAHDCIATVARRHPRASHNCWAYIIGDVDAIEHASDAGEPSGTAGRPMLNTLKRHELCNVAAVVTRYFGGVKLGVRGLIDAYSATLEGAIERARIKPVIHLVHWQVSAPYDVAELLKVRLRSLDAVIANECYDALVSFSVAIERDSALELETLLSTFAGTSNVCAKKIEDPPQ